MERDRESDEWDFETAAQGARRGLVSELFKFLGENKKRWLTPSFIASLALDGLVMLGGTAAAPFIYTRF